MFNMKTMTPLKASKQTSAAASKIKNKILNTSSYFKVSLKTNNRALALALEAQRERSRQLETEVMYLQKQVEALCFELATRKYKDRKLRLILKNLHTNTLQHFAMVADLFSDCDLPKLSQENREGPNNINEERPAAESLTDQSPPPPPPPKDLLSSPSKNVTGDMPEKDVEENVHSKPRTSTDTDKDHPDAEKRRIQGAVGGASHPSRSLRDEVERLSMMSSQSGFDLKPLPCPQNHPTASWERAKPAPADTEPELNQSNKQEKTVLLDTTMEMTQSDHADIVAVETKAKKNPGGSSKPKRKKKKKEEAFGLSSEFGNVPEKKNSAGSGRVEVPAAPADTESQADDKEETGAGCESPKKISRIPKMSRCEDGSSRKKPKLKSTKKSGSGDAVPPVPTDSDNHKRNGVKPHAEKDGAEDAASRITCRRSRTKGRRMSSAVRTSSLCLLVPPPAGESAASGFEQLHKEAEDVRSSEELCPGDIVCPTSVDKRQSEIQTATHSAGRHKSKRRGTFVVSVLSPEAAEPDFLPVAGSVSPHGGGGGGEASVQDTLSSSCKRPRLSAWDSESVGEHYGSDGYHDALLRHQDATPDTASQKPKRARREEAGRSSKKKTAHRKEVDDLLNDQRKKKSSRGNKGFRPEDEAPRPLQDATDDPDRNRPLSDSRWNISEDADIFEHFCDSRPRKDLKTKERQVTARQRVLTENKNPRETFVVYRRKTRDNASDASSHAADAIDEAARREDLLADEMPPWLAMDVSAANTEGGSFLNSPARGTPVGGAAAGAAPGESASPAGRVLTSLTNAIMTPDSETGGRTRRRHGVVSYKEPSLNSKLRRGDKHAEGTFLSSPVFRDGKKKKQKKTTAAKTKLDMSNMDA